MSPSATRPPAAPPLFLLALAALCGCLDRQEPPRAGFSSEKVEERRQALGRGLYAHYCAHCHGESGAGDGLNAYALPVKPPDFSSRAWQESRTDAALEDFIRLGGRLSGRSPLCPALGTSSSERVLYLRCYLRSLARGT